MPENRALSGLCQGMIEAWKLQGNEKAAILFVIEDVTYNICDQRFHEFSIRARYPEIKVIRKSLTQIHEQGRLGDSNELLMLVYYVNNNCRLSYYAKSIMINSF